MINLRTGIFETNSSSVHTICLTDDDTYQDWLNGKLYYNIESKYNSLPEFVTYKEAVSADENFPYSCGEEYDYRYGWSFKDAEGYLHNRIFLTFKEFFDLCYFETYNTEYFSPKGEEIHAFGYYGHD